MQITHEHIEYIHKEMDRMKSNNVSIYLPELTYPEIHALEKDFKVVRRTFFGYVYFERKETP